MFNLVKNMNSIFSYIDYRKFLKDYYNSEKESKLYFSYRFFSQKAGIKSPVFLKEVYDGKKNLSRNMMESLKRENFGKVYPRK